MKKVIVALFCMTLLSSGCCMFKSSSPEKDGKSVQTSRSDCKCCVDGCACGDCQKCVQMSADCKECSQGCTCGDCVRCTPSDK
jgi:hypothetical protein